VAGVSSWRGPSINFSALGGTNVFNSNSPYTWDMDNINEGETITRTISAIDAYVVQSATAPTVVNSGGWWEDSIIAIGLYIPGLGSNNTVTPTPLDSTDDNWIFQANLVCDRVTLDPNHSLVIAHYGFPGGKIDTVSRQGPVPAGFSFPIQFAWAWDIPFGYNYTTGPSFNSVLGCRFWERSLFLH
jgi:hypothetical protein